MTARGVVGATAAVAVGTAIVVGLALMDPPSEARARRLDERRVSDLARTSGDVDVYWTRVGALPRSLDDLAREPGLGGRIADPESGEPYGFRLVDSTRYELCATFAVEGDAARPGPDARFWAHGAGRQCFTAEASRVEPLDRPRPPVDRRP